MDTSDVLWQVDLMAGVSTGTACLTHFEQRCQNLALFPHPLLGEHLWCSAETNNNCGSILSSLISFVVTGSPVLEPMLCKQGINVLKGLKCNHILTGNTNLKLRVQAFCLLRTYPLRMKQQKENLKKKSFSMTWAGPRGPSLSHLQI